MRKHLARLVSTFTFFLFAISATAVCSGQTKIVGMSIACSNDKVYTWYSDKTVSVGTSENLSAYEPPHRYTLPFGKTPDDIVEIGIASTDHVYVWYKDLTVSSGTSTDLDKYQPRHPYRIPKSTNVNSIVGIDIACKTDHVYAWYSSGYLTSGTSVDLDKYITMRTGIPQVQFKSFSTVEGMGIAKNDHVYVWYSDRTASSGTSTRLIAYRDKYDYVLGPGPCDISADPPKINRGVVSAVGIRGPTCTSLAQVVVRLRTNDTRLPRKILSEKQATGGNFEVPITYACDGRSELKVFTEIEKTGRVVRSAERSLPGCFRVPGEVK